MKFLNCLYHTCKLLFSHLEPSPKCVHWIRGSILFKWYVWLLLWPMWGGTRLKIIRPSQKQARQYIFWSTWSIIGCGHLARLYPKCGVHMQGAHECLFTTRALLNSTHCCDSIMSKVWLDSRRNLGFLIMFVFVLKCLCLC